MSTEKGSFVYLIIIGVLFGLSVGMAYYRYMVRQDFVYFPAEEQIPNHFSLSSYSQL